MHLRGINIRYLGYIALLTPAWPFLHDLCVKEMIVRTAKHILRGILAETDSSSLAKVVAHFFNCFLGVESKGKKVNAAKKKKKKSGPKAKLSAASLTHSSLWSAIHQQVQERFQYELPDNIRNTLSVIPPSDVTKAINFTDGRIPVLRNLCQKVGIQILSRDYDFSLETPFQHEDILDLFPVVKHLHPKTVDGHELLEAGVSYLAQGRLDVAFELLSEALVIFSQVYGPMHQATAICFSNMAMVLYQSGDPAEAAIYQQKAVIISERVQGLDHRETIQSYVS